MPDDNLTRFYFAKFQRAEEIFDYGHGNNERADDICCELVSDFRCPRLLQVQAYQLRSLCTEDYWLAKRHLTKAMEIIAHIPDQDHPMIKKYKAHTGMMMGEVTAKLRSVYKARGQDVPDEQPLEDFQPTVAEELSQLTLKEMREQGLSSQDIIEQGGGFVPASQYRPGSGPPPRTQPPDTSSAAVLEEWKRDEDEQLEEDMLLAWKAVDERTRKTLEEKAPAPADAATEDTGDAMDTELPPTPPSDDDARMED